MFYDRYVYLCEQKGISPSKAAIDAGISKSLVTKWKTNNTKTPSPDVLTKLSQYFEMGISELLGENEQKNKPTTINGDELSEAERDFILLLRSIPEQERDMVSEMIRAALRSKGLL